MKNIVLTVMRQQISIAKFVVYHYVSIVRKREIMFVIVAEKTWERMTNMDTDAELISKYIQVSFIQRLGSEKLKRRGLKVGEWLVVAFPSSKETDQYKIFKLHNGEPVVDTIFLRLKDAIGFAELLNKTYGKEMFIWKDYPNVDIIEMAQWTVKNGVSLYEIAKEMAKQNKVDTPQIKQMFREHHFVNIM